MTEHRPPASAAQPFDGTGLGDWQVVSETVQAVFKTGSMSKGLEFATRIGAAADAMNHHPDMKITYPTVHVLLTTHDAGGLTALDSALARLVSKIADEMGIPADTPPSV